MTLWRYWVWLAGLSALAAVSHAQVVPTLRVACQADYSIYHWSQEFRPDPEQIYSTPGVEVGQRFRFKVLAASRQAHSDTLIIVVSYWDGDQFTVLQHSTYDAAMLQSARRGGGALTGEQRVYSPDLGRQLRYQCRLLTDKEPA